MRDRVGVVTFGGVLHWLAPGSGVTHALRIADALASSEVFMSYVAHDVTVVPPAILPSRALVLAITPLLDERGARALLDLCARGHDVAVIEIDAPALLGASATASRACGRCGAPRCARGWPSSARRRPRGTASARWSRCSRR